MISVIIPIYKADQFLVRCVESILKQSYTDFELVLVDDGSPDNCPSICDDFAKKDSRVKVIHQENSGEAAARNTGVDNSSGEYIAFVDSDDYVDEQYLEAMLDLQKKYDADFVSCQCRYLHGDGSITMHPDITEKTEEIVIDLDKSDFRAWYLSGGVWCRLYKKSVINEYGLRFDSKYRIGCDFVFNMAYLNVSNVSVATPRCLYTYVQNDASIMHTVNVDAGISGMYATEAGRKCIESHTKLSDQIEISNLIGSVAYISRDDVKKVITAEQTKEINEFIKVKAKNQSKDFQLRLSLQKNFPFFFRALRRLFGLDILRKYK